MNPNFIQSFQKDFTPTGTTPVRQEILIASGGTEKSQEKQHPVEQSRPLPNGNQVIVQTVEEGIRIVLANQLRNFQTSIEKTIQDGLGTFSAKMNYEIVEWMNAIDNSIGDVAKRIKTAEESLGDFTKSFRVQADSMQQEMIVFHQHLAESTKMVKLIDEKVKSVEQRVVVLDEGIQGVSIGLKGGLQLMNDVVQTSNRSFMTGMNIFDSALGALNHNLNETANQTAVAVKTFHEALQSLEQEKKMMMEGLGSFNQQYQQEIKTLKEFTSGLLVSDSTHNGNGVNDPINVDTLLNGTEESKKNQKRKKDSKQDGSPEKKRNRSSDQHTINESKTSDENQQAMNPSV
eukprot:TRINITY_DN11660_c0_g1_i1.p1 TRINITY_DN11660_c0_g1~~TRINITY_DN11660_c0_g1_i1.p1  ORF type:complete len:346 (+),score=86.44 TRINITY_DN11660_c0_g1_i1:54-1091(+)